MLNLLKYEFRKALNSFLVLLGLIAGLEVYFLFALKKESEGHMVAALIMLMMCAFVAAVFVFIRGVSSYSGELKSRSSYLIFMTPNSTLKIVGSKFAYTFVNGLFFAALFAAVAVGDFALMLHEFGEYESFMNSMKHALSMYGVYVDQIGYGILFMIVYAFLSVLSVIAIAYLAITVSHTLFRDKKWRWLPQLALFIGLSWLVNWACAQFPSALDELTMVEARVYNTTIAVTNIGEQSLWDAVIPSLLPTAGISLLTILLSWIGCAVLLEKKVSL